MRKRDKVVCKRWTGLKVDTSLFNTSYQHFLWHTPVQEVAQLAKRWLQEVQHLAGGAQWQ